MSQIENKKVGAGLLLAFASPFLFAAFDVGVRILSADVSVYGLLFLRGFVGVALAFLFARLMGVRPRFNKTGALCLVGLCSAFSTVCTTTAITFIPLYQAVVILYLYPAFAVVLALVFRVDKMTLRAALGVATAFAGCVLLVWPDAAAGLELTWAHGVGLLGSVFYAACLILIRRLGDGHSGLEPFLFYSLASIAAAWPLSLVFGSGLGIDSLGEVGKGAALACLGSAAQLMAFAAVKYLPPFKVGVIGTLEILGTALASWLIFSDPFTARAGVGAAVIVYAAFGFNPKKPGPPAEAEPESEPKIGVRCDAAGKN
jgi:drug/metabolite transporter (DMT)-like permease